MGSVESYEIVQGKRYRVRYRKPDHSQAAKRGFVTKKAAELYLAKMEVSKSSGTFVDPSRGKATVAHWLDKFMDERADLAPTTRERMSGAIDVHIKPALGAYSLGSLDHEIVQAWAATLSKTQGAWSVRKIVNVLSGSLEKAVKSNRISFNAAHGLDLPSISQGAKRYLTAEQVRDLADAVDTIGHGKELGYGLAIYVLSYCGLRWSELSGLRVKDINFRRARLEVQHTITETEGVQVEGVPKSYEARSIGVPATILEALQAQVVGKSPDAPVFSGARGGWLRNRVFRRGWLTAAATAIDEVGLTPHELRHTAASLAISAGANVKAVQRMLGHASAAVTLDVYADLFEDDVDEVSAVLDQTIRKASVSKTCPDEHSVHSSDLTI